MKENRIMYGPRNAREPKPEGKFYGQDDRLAKALERLQEYREWVASTCGHEPDSPVFCIAKCTAENCPNRRVP